MMTPDEFKKQMKDIANGYDDDVETCHCLMDEVMCELLKELGYSDGIDIFTDTPKWYA